MFIKNYLYELPDDIQGSIYRMVFSRCLRDIENDVGIKYMQRLYGAVNNPRNTCIYSILPLGSPQEVAYRQPYKYERVFNLENFGATRDTRDTRDTSDTSGAIYLDRTNLLVNTSQYQSNTISYFIFPLFTAKKTLKRYLGSQLNLHGYYKKDMVSVINVIDDRIDIVFTRNFQCNADIYYYILVGYNVLYNSISNIIYGEENGIMFVKFVEIFRWYEINNIFQGYNLYNNKIIPIFEGKIDKN
jgi:hypothetical protein